MIAYGMPASGQLEQNLWRQAQRLDAGELFTLGFSNAFERTNLAGLLREDTRIMRAEQEAGTYDPDYALQAAEMTAAGWDVKHAHALTEEEYKASEWYRTRPDGKAAVEYTPNMTPQRAQILAEVYDRRRHEERILERDRDTAARKALVFGASFLAQLPDPINLLPIGGALAKGAGLAARIGHGALQGAVGTALSDAILYPVANARGEDFGFADVALDITFGAAFGGGIGALGFKVAQWRDKRQAVRLRSEADAVGRDLAPLLEDSGHFTREESLLAARRVSESLAAMPDGLARTRKLRSMLGGESRAGEGAVLDRALKALSDGEDFDVAAWRRQWGLPRSPFPHVRTADLIASGERPDWGDLTPAEILPKAEEFYAENLALKTVTSQGREVAFRSTKAGWGKIRGRTPDADKLKLLPYMDRIIEGAEWVFAETARRETHAAKGMAVHTLLTRVEYKGRNLEMRMVVREDPNGKFFYDFFNETEPPVQRNTPPESPGSSAGGRAKGGGETGSVSPAGVPRQTGRPNSENPVSGETIRQDGDPVNLEIRDVTPDPARPAPLPDYRAPDLPASPDAALRAEGIDPGTGRSYDESEVLRLEAEGRVSPEDADALRAAVAEYERISTREEIALSLVGCVVGGL